ncbi:hypothetical protein MJO28_011901 [Puccinia striiformis f. sp. tritici]|uniref:Uncharacterized protein n=2 Tax=Puccinia striiformis TaxID=27350 RepID=A0A2S4UWR1_9BASI|nr:hypothetical protein MJO28_011901 [Puccinia striiformis f. sp. tritici]KAI7947129.1 hypothetical protein MJO29_011656 [Puccinia striiformis f. sp. tritici]POW01729.1 hypothetical protein PSHT_12393 [Puccinia striiformis]
MTRRKWPKQMPTSVQSKKSRRLEYVVQLGGLINQLRSFCTWRRRCPRDKPRPEVKSDAAAPGLHGEKIRSQVEQTVKRQNLTVTKLPDLAELEWGPGKCTSTTWHHRTIGASTQPHLKVGGVKRPSWFIPPAVAASKTPRDQRGAMYLKWCEQGASWLCLPIQPYR